MKTLPFRITLTDGTQVDEQLSKLDIFAYEDQFRTSLFDAFDQHGAIKISVLYRMAWIAMRARHGEKREFIDWVEQVDPDVSLRLGDNDPPTGETSGPLDDAPPVSPPEPASTRSE